MNRNQLRRLFALLLVPLMFVTACESGGKSEDGQSAEDREQNATDRSMNRMTQSQQIPEFDWSQERQTLIDVLTVRGESTHGTAYATTLSGELLWWCPTAGAPVPSTYQLTNPYDVEWRSGHGGEDASAVTARAEPTGIYSGESAATWTTCLDNAGTAFGVYEEANVGWRSGIVDNLPADKRAKVDEITFEFTTSETGG